MLCTGCYRARPCLKAYAVASARDESPDFVKMLLTWRATVFSLMKSSVAIARFVLPAATSVITSLSRRLNPSRPRRPRQASEAIEIGPRAQLREHAARRFELELRAGGVAELATGDPDPARARAPPDAAPRAHATSAVPSGASPAPLVHLPPPGARHRPRQRQGHSGTGRPAARRSRQAHRPPPALPSTSSASSMTSTQAGSRRDRATGSCASSPSARRIATEGEIHSPLRQPEQRHPGLGVPVRQGWRGGRTPLPPSARRAVAGSPPAGSRPIRACPKPPVARRATRTRAGRNRGRHVHAPCN